MVSVTGLIFLEFIFYILQANEIEGNFHAEDKKFFIVAHSAYADNDEQFQT